MAWPARTGPMARRAQTDALPAPVELAVQEEMVDPVEQADRAVIRQSWCLTTNPCLLAWWRPTAAVDREVREGLRE